MFIFNITTWPSLMRNEKLDLLAYSKYAFRVSAHLSNLR